MKPAVLLSPISPVLGSDYSSMVEQILVTIFAMGGGAVILGVGTSAVLFRFCRRKWTWFLIPVFAICWFGLILGAFELWIEFEYRFSAPEQPNPPPPGPQGIGG